MNSADMFSLIPNPDDLLALPIEEQGRLVLKLLAQYDGPRKAIVYSNFFNRAADSPAGPNYGHRQTEVDSSLMEAWGRLENQGFLVKAPSLGANCFFVGKAGKDFLSGNARPLTFTPKTISGQMALIADIRLTELRAVVSPKFDFKKLVRLCEELNTAYQQECYFATAMLTRALLDHVPPVFGKNKFTEVTSNYSGGKSFKDAMQHLENASRKIADSLLHTPIRQSETLPTAQQVYCSQQLDALLSEIVRISH